MEINLFKGYLDHTTHIIKLQSGEPDPNHSSAIVSNQCSYLEMYWHRGDENLA